MKYFIGLDVGTNSIGYAMTDKNYNLIRLNGKTMWGVRSFDTAETAENRRMKRANRRRLDRLKRRIKLLRDLLAEEVLKVDEGFYHRLNESQYVPEDKRTLNGELPNLPYSVFCDKGYTDKDYHKQFPTVYHLRKYLMETKETPDIRLVYLALSHIMKHRGHFLIDGTLENTKDFYSVFHKYCDIVNAELSTEIEEYDESEERDYFIEQKMFDFDEDQIGAMKEILAKRDITKSQKASDIADLLKLKTNSPEMLLIKLAIGLTVNLRNIFPDIVIEDKNDKRDKICFSESFDEDKQDEIRGLLGEKYVVVAAAKTLYDWTVLVNLLNDTNSVSEAKIKSYNKHKEDLVILKRVIKKHCSKDVYNEMFGVNTKKSKDECNYSAYVGIAKKNAKKVVIKESGPARSKNCFYKYVKKVLSTISNPDEDVFYILNEIEKDTFMPKQVIVDNGSLPYQVHEYELDMILENMSDKHPVIKENAKKIKQLFLFRIPYWLGPLNGVERNGKSTNWAVRKPGKEHEEVFPWNMDEIFDSEKSIETFMSRLINKCTYLHEEDVLPKHSLLYARFMVLNELNNVRINGELLPVALKQDIYHDLFMAKQKVTKNMLKKYLVKRGLYETVNDITIDGIDGDFKGSLVAYHNLKQILADIVLSEEEKEDIVRNIVLFNQDKKLLKQRLSSLYPQLDTKQIDKLSNLSYKGWGRLSRELLSGITSNKNSTGEDLTVIGTMWETQDNLMQVVGSKKYGFDKIIEDKTKRNRVEDITYEDIDALYVSPSVKRAIHNAVLVAKELTKGAGCPAEGIFVEMARGEGEKTRTKSRKMQILELYKNCKKGILEFDKKRINVKSLKEELDRNDISDAALRSDKLFLYFTQMGRCMYSGDAIDLDELLTNKFAYDIDHIYPQSKTGDGSLDNRVLVKRKLNEDKDDIFPISKALPGVITDTQRAFWKALLDKKLISKEKYYRLTRETELSDEELAGFIARQLVETRQSTKAVASILKQMFPETEIVYVKASEVSKFRNDFVKNPFAKEDDGFRDGNFLKIRDMNDLHHAKDAYLNIVVGNGLFTKFTKDAGWFIKKYGHNKTYNLNKLFTGKFDIKRGGKTAWVAGENGTIQTVRKTMARNDILVVRDSQCVTGALYKEQPVKKGSSTFPIKSNDERLCNEEKYGGYTGVVTSHCALVEATDKKGERYETFVSVPILMAKKIKDNPDVFISYLETLGLIDPVVLIPVVKKHTRMCINGAPVSLVSGRTARSKRCSLMNEAQLLLSGEPLFILKKLTNYISKCNSKEKLSPEHYGLTHENLMFLYDVFYDKLNSNVYKKLFSSEAKVIEKGRETFKALTLEDKCRLLNEILHLFQCNSRTANLSIIGGSTEAGRLLVSLNIPLSKKGDCFIHQSVTGLYEQRVDLTK